MVLLISSLSVLVCFEKFRCFTQFFSQPLRILRRIQGIKPQIDQDWIVRGSLDLAADGTTGTAAYFLRVRSKRILLNMPVPVLDFLHCFERIEKGKRFVSGNCDGLQFFPAQYGSETGFAHGAAFADNGSTG